MTWEPDHLFGKTVPDLIIDPDCGGCDWATLSFRADMNLQVFILEDSDGHWNVSNLAYTFKDPVLNLAFSSPDFSVRKDAITGHEMLHVYDFTQAYSAIVSYLQSFERNYADRAECHRFAALAYTGAFQILTDTTAKSIKEWDPNESF